MRLRSPVEQLLQGFEKLCPAYVGFTPSTSNARPLTKRTA
jgi:hypothetical protein